MSRFVRTAASQFALLLALTLAGCDDDEPPLTLFDGPIDVAVLEPNPVLDVHAGFVTNFRSGKITKLDIKHHTTLRDNPLGSWVRGLPIATGQDRLIEQIAVATSFDGAEAEEETGDYYMTAFVSDSSRSQLLVVPYLDSRVPVGPECATRFGSIPRYPICLREVEGQPNSGDSMSTWTLEVYGITPAADGTSPPTLTSTGYQVKDFRLREGHTSTETWTATFDAARQHFLLRGTRSGLQQRVAKIGQAYFSDDNEVEFTVVAAGGTEGAGLPEGATFSFGTDNGIQEIDMPGVIEDLRIVPEQRRLFATVQTEDGRGLLVTFDLDALDGQQPVEIASEIELCPVGSDFQPCPVPSRPLAMDLDFDAAHQRLFVAEGADYGGVYQVDLNTDAYAVLTGFGPNIDVAHVEQNTDTSTYDHLFVANLDHGTISLYDLAAGRMVDINPHSPQIDVIEVNTPVRGLAASKIPVPISEQNVEHVPYESILVGATTFIGELIAIRGESGCMTFATAAGAYVTSANIPWVDQGTKSNPIVLQDQETGNWAVLSQCGGVSKSELWTFTYDQTLQGYRVRGSRTNALGEYQQRIAYEDERYVSDGGEISVMILAGTLPTTDGDTLSFGVTGNVVPIATGDMPGDLELYTYTYGDRNQGWTAARYRTIAVVPSTATDTALKADLARPGVFGVMFNWQ